MNLYFFDRDNSGHWYMIPAEEKGLWQTFKNEDEDNEDANALFNSLFSAYRTNGGISDILFTPEQL